jgi:glycosyltransferase involved in cell wall biosynthesis
MRDDFGVLILTHGRANNVKTVKSLQKAGYTGKWYIVIDDEDDQEDEYRRIYGERVIQFCKEERAKITDVGDTSKERRCIIFARNEAFAIARKLGLRYFIELDDDYNNFEYLAETGQKLKHTKIKQIEKVFEAMIAFLDASNAKSVAMAQGGDLLGGVKDPRWKEQLLRKAMNSFIFRTDNPLNFVGRINEDVNTYVTGGQCGELFFTTLKVMLNQEQTQKAKGGMSGNYLEGGTYVKTFYSVMYAPSCVKVATMGVTAKRYHHHVYWNACCPKIINEKWRKANG